MEVKEKIITRSSFKRKTILELVLVLSIIILLNYISSFYFKRLDLTVENRYTLAPSTVKMLENLDDVVYVKVYLSGDLPIGFKRLENSIRETLDEFRIYAKDNIQYEFINPSENPDKKSREDVYRQLYKNGITPTNLQEKDEEGSTSQKVIFPGAMLSYHGIDIPVDFLKTNMSQSPEQNLNGSIEEIEYSLITTIRKLNREFGQRIAFITGHGEIPEPYVADITGSLSEYFSVDRVEIGGLLNSLSERVQDSSGIRVRVKYDLIIIAKPDSAFKENDKYIIDQYLMYGGKILWLIDPVNVDSFGLRSSTLALIRELNIENDMLFKYGVRVNPNLVQDVQCAVIPVNTAISGTQPKFTPASWVYFPLLQPVSTHPIGRNVNLVFGQFVSSVDVVGDDQKVKKTTLLTTSQHSRVMNAPVRIGLELINEKIDPARFEQANIPIAVLLEGKFRSIYNNRLTPEMYDSREIAFKEESYPTKMVVIGDGEMIRNNVKKIGYNKEPMPLGYDRYTGETFGNKEFLLNVINYMLDDSGFMNLRTREIKLRLLDRAKLENSRTFWQIVNTLIPVLLIIFIGLLISFFRKHKYTKTSVK